jgi:hypothetical protein
MENEPVVPGLDTSRPNIARVYDYWLGGKENFAADRELAEKMLAVYPGIAAMYRDNRQFVTRAVTWAAGQGIARFLDLGAGLPTHPAVHESARDVNPDARVAYVDNDPLVVVHAEALLARGAEGDVTAVRADLTDPAAVLSQPEVAMVTSGGEPVCVILAAVLHFYEAPAAREIAAAYVSWMPPGSVMVISCGHSDDAALADSAQEQYTATTWRNHSREDIESFFAGLPLVPPGLAQARAWRGGMTGVPGKPAAPAYVLGGVATKPELRAEG